MQARIRSEHDQVMGGVQRSVAVIVYTVEWTPDGRHCDMSRIPANVGCDRVWYGTVDSGYGVEAAEGDSISHPELNMES
jgi:hypothetical protein